MSMLSQAADAKLILVPKGDDGMPCVQAFEALTGITVPSFQDRKLEARAGRQTFWKVKGRDIPYLIAAGYGDIGLTGSDSCEEYIGGADEPVAYESFGPRMCRFVLLAPRGQAAAARRRLKDPSFTTHVATSFPNLLLKCAADNQLRLKPAPIVVSGSVEIMPRVLGVPLVADLVSTGSTAQSNDLVEVATLLEVYPAVVTRGESQPKPRPANPDGYKGIDRIDATLAKRSRQMADRTVSSPTLKLLRDPNLAGKKAGEEFAESLMAIFGEAGLSECEGEIADSIYTQLVAARSRGKAVELGNIIRILIERNAGGRK